MPYVPMRNPEKEVSQERMAEILAKHAQPKVEIRNQAEPAPSGAGDSAPVASGSLPNTLAPDGGGSLLPVSPKLQWVKPEPLSRLIYTACGQYRVRKWSGAEAIREPPNYKYQVEKLVDGAWFYACGPTCNSFAEAREVAEKAAT